MERRIEYVLEKWGLGGRRNGVGGKRNGARARKIGWGQDKWVVAR